MSNEFPEPWKSLAEPVGITSYGQLANKSGLSRPTVYSAVSGRSAKPQPKTIAGLAKAFRITSAELLEILGQSQQEDVETYEPPLEASLLTKRERKAVDEIIRLLVASRSKPFVLGISKLGDKSTALKAEDNLTEEDKDYLAEAAEYAENESGFDEIWQNYENTKGNPAPDPFEISEDTAK